MINYLNPKLFFLIFICFGVTSCVGNSSHTSQRAKPVIYEIVVLPLVSDNVIWAVKDEHINFERELVNVLNRRGVSVFVAPTSYSQQSFTRTSQCDISTGDFVTLKRLSGGELYPFKANNIIFGYLEEVSNSILMNGCVYSVVSNKLTPISTSISNRLTSAEVKPKINDLATKVIELIHSQSVSNDTEKHETVSEVGSNEKTDDVGILPFSKLVSDNVKVVMGNYYNNFENELVNALQTENIFVTPVKYPSGQQPFSYEEMEAPIFEIDADDFATPEQLLAGISSTLGFTIFGHVEEISDSLYLVARVYLKADNKVRTMPIQKISITTNFTTSEVDTIIGKLAIDIAGSVRGTSSSVSSEPVSPDNGEGLVGLDD